jgi:hypothetical protein
MFARSAQVPDLVPQLSRGKHRRPRQGACFMEMASYLAGERWSDRPACTHPLLGAVARLVNDHTTDAGRSGLVEMIPSVVGLTSDDPRVDVLIMLRCATTALPVVSAGRQRALAVSVLAGERALDGLDGRPPGQLTERSRVALARVPHAVEWAERFTREVGPAAPGSVRIHGAPATVRLAVVGIAEACIGDPDALLRDLLAATIAVVSDVTEVTEGTDGVEPGRGSLAVKPNVTNVS